MAEVWECKQFGNEASPRNETLVDILVCYFWNKGCPLFGHLSVIFGVWVATKRSENLQIEKQITIHNYHVDDILLWPHFIGKSLQR